MRGICAKYKEDAKGVWNLSRAPGIPYRKEGKYYVPNWELNDTTDRPILKYGAMRRNFLMNHKEATFLELVSKAQLMEHLADIEERAWNMMDLLMAQMVERDPPPDKEADMMAWVGHMNMLFIQAEEIVMAQVIHV